MFARSRRLKMPVPLALAPPFRISIPLAAMVAVLHLVSATATAQTPSLVQNIWSGSGASLPGELTDVNGSIEHKQGWDLLIQS